MLDEVNLGTRSHCGELQRLVLDFLRPTLPLALLEREPHDKLVPRVLAQATTLSLRIVQISCMQSISCNLLVGEMTLSHFAVIFGSCLKQLSLFLTSRRLKVKTKDWEDNG